VWAVHTALHVAPQDQLLLGEFLLSGSEFKPDDHADPEKVRAQSFRELMIEARDGPATLVIDGRTYPPVAAIALGPFVDPQTPDQQLAVKIATFTPITS
jgi:hypothetical protein